jgi:hypothetical protein
MTSHTGEHTWLSPLRHSLRSHLRDDSHVAVTVTCTWTLLRGPVEPKEYPCRTLWFAAISHYSDLSTPNQRCCDTLARIR